MVSTVTNYLITRYYHHFCWPRRIKSNCVDTGKNIFAIFHYDDSRGISGNYKLITIAFNPSVLEQFGRDFALTTERRLLINLAIDYIQVFEKKNNEIVLKISQDLQSEIYKLQLKVIENILITKF